MHTRTLKDKLLRPCFGPADLVIRFSQLPTECQLVLGNSVISSATLVGMRVISPLIDWGCWDMATFLDKGGLQP